MDFRAGFRDILVPSIKAHGRTGQLFESHFKRIAVEREAYFSQLIAYIHFNPVKHGFAKDFREYPYSSYHAHLSSAETKLNRTDVLAWFGGRDGYVRFHSSQSVGYLPDELVLD